MEENIHSCASGVFDFKKAVQLVTKRGKFMAEAVPNEVGGMCAILGELEDSEVKRLVKKRPQ